MCQEGVGEGSSVHTRTEKKKVFLILGLLEPGCAMEV